MRRLYDIAACILVCLGYLIFGYGAYFVYFTTIPHYSFLFLTPALFCILCGFTLRAIVQRRLLEEKTQP